MGGDASVSAIRKIIKRLLWWRTRAALTLGLRYSDVVADGVEGWMTDEELAWLRSQAAKMSSIVEVGSWKGRSTKALLEACPGQVVAVDFWPGYRGVERQFRRNVGHYPNLILRKMPSLEAAKTVDAADMVFLDGAHDYTSVTADIAAWLPKTRKLICGHDFDKANNPGVVLAVMEAFGEVETCGTIWYVWV